MHALHKIAVGESSVSRMNVVASTSRAYANQVEGERGQMRMIGLSLTHWGWRNGCCSRFGKWNYISSFSSLFLLGHCLRGPRQKSGNVPSSAHSRSHVQV